MQNGFKPILCQINHHGWTIRQPLNHALRVCPHQRQAAKLPPGKALDPIDIAHSSKRRTRRRDFPVYAQLPENFQRAHIDDMGLGLPVKLTAALIKAKGDPLLL
jgi:hypothetical protein